MASTRNEQSDSRDTPAVPVMAVEVLRNAAATGETKGAGKEEGGISPFWRIFGGTVLSIVALVSLTLYQQLSNGLAELRHEVEQRTTKDEFVTSRSKTWEKMFEIQRADDHMNLAVTDRCGRLEQQAKDNEAARAQLQDEVKWLREAAVSALKDRSALLEQQVKASQAEHQEMVKELRRLRARLTGLEGRQPGSVPGSEPR